MKALVWGTWRTTLAALSTSQVAGLTTAQVDGLSTNQLVALSTNQVAALTTRYSRSGPSRVAIRSSSIPPRAFQSSV